MTAQPGHRSLVAPFSPQDKAELLGPSQPHLLLALRLCHMDHYLFPIPMLCIIVHVQGYLPFFLYP